ncbi:hypothetical protein JTB14_007373 [Gonioctena quinquepunctata]|nr:hypothetical protein JTB14_007373 [Gonioctena quinquepunctata]
MNNQTPTHRTVAQLSKLKLYNTQTKKSPEIETPPPNNGEDDQTLFDKFRKPDDAIKKKSRASVSKEDLASIEKQMLPAKEFIDKIGSLWYFTYQELSDFLKCTRI